MDVPPLHPGCWDTLAPFCLPMGSRDGAWPCFVLTPSFPDSPKPSQTPPNPSPQPLHPCHGFPSFPLVLVWSGEQQVAENFRSVHSLQVPSQGCPIPPHPCLANLSNSSQFSQKDKMEKLWQISHGAGARMQQRRALLRAARSHDEPPENSHWELLGGCSPWEC